MKSSSSCFRRTRVSFPLGLHLQLPFIFRYSLFISRLSFHLMGRTQFHSCGFRYECDMEPVVRTPGHRSFANLSRVLRPSFYVFNSQTSPRSSQEVRTFFRRSSTQVIRRALPGSSTCSLTGLRNPGTSQQQQSYQA